MGSAVAYTAHLIRVLLFLRREYVLPFGVIFVAAVCGTDVASITSALPNTGFSSNDIISQMQYGCPGTQADYVPRQIMIQHGIPRMPFQNTKCTLIMFTVRARTWSLVVRDRQQNFCRFAVLEEFGHLVCKCLSLVGPCVSHRRYVRV